MRFANAEYEMLLRHLVGEESVTTALPFTASVPDVIDFTVNDEDSVVLEHLEQSSNSDLSDLDFDEIYRIQTLLGAAADKEKEDSANARELFLLKKRNNRIHNPWFDVPPGVGKKWNDKKSPILKSRSVLNSSFY